jgi:hypothetical protein
MTSITGAIETTSIYNTLFAWKVPPTSPPSKDGDEPSSYRFYQCMEVRLNVHECVKVNADYSFREQKNTASIHKIKKAWPEHMDQLILSYNLAGMVSLKNNSS